MRRFRLRLANGVRPASDGDLLDSSHPSPEELAFFARCLRDLDRAGVPMFGIPGNHEYSHVGAVSVYDALPGFERIHGRVVEVGGIRIYGIDGHRHHDEMAGFEGNAGADAAAGLALNGSMRGWAQSGSTLDVRRDEPATQTSTTGWTFRSCTSPRPQIL